ncbi:MAG TPA: hypothetical protein VFG07_02135 [Thermoplasmata archaeon]|nr:hypothetical protein [Thermoplasmata archaeon]
MRPSRLIVFWVVVIALLLFVEFAELTHLFTIPVQSALLNVLSFIFALFFTTVLALVGAVFIGVYIAHRLSSPTGFTPFEEEMLKMRSEVAQLKQEVEGVRRVVAPDPAPSPRSADPKGRT